MPKTKAIFFFLFIEIVTIKKFMQKKLSNDDSATVYKRRQEACQENGSIVSRYDGRYYDWLKEANNYNDKRRKVNTEETTLINDEKYGIKECDLMQAFYCAFHFERPEFISCWLPDLHIGCPSDTLTTRADSTNFWHVLKHFFSFGNPSYDDFPRNSTRMLDVYSNH